jgi:hypothetical protein
MRGPRGEPRGAVSRRAPVRVGFARVRSAARDAPGTVLALRGALLERGRPFSPKSAKKRRNLREDCVFRSADASIARQQVFDGAQYVDSTRFEKAEVGRRQG